MTRYMRLLLAILLLNSLFLNSQTNYRKSEYLYETTKHNEFIRLNEPYYQTNPSPQLAFEIGDAFLSLKKYEKAIIYYEMGLTTSTADEKTNANYFSALYEYGEYDLAKQIATSHKARFNKSSLLDKLENVQKFKNQDPTYFETNLKLNTEFDEFGFQPLTGSFKIINTDNLLQSKSYVNKTLNPYIVNYKSNGDEVSRLNEITPVNNLTYDVITHYDESENVVYITRSVPGKDHNILKVFVATLNQKFQLINPVEFPYNGLDYSVGHVCVSLDNEVLYFVSDKPGGYGGADIYRCMKLENGSWGAPINIGPEVNSPGDELYPYISPQGNTLYFSSNYHSLFGGLDLNKSNKTRFHSFQKPQNMGLPFNSPQDDFGMVFLDNYGTEGFFSSDRIEGGKGGDDIYYFSYQNNKICKDPIKNFKMLVVDKKTKEPIPNVNLKMTVKLDGRIFESVSDENGEVHLTVEGCNDFDVEATRDFYLNNSFYYDGFRKQVTIELDKKELNNIVELESIYYEKAKFEVPSSANDQMKKLANLLNRNKDVKIELSSHTDARGDDKFNQILSTKRAESIVTALVSLGVNKSQLSPVGYGESKILNECLNDVKCNETEHEKNRRTEIKIIEISGQKAE